MSAMENATKMISQDPQDPVSARSLAQSLSREKLYRESRDNINTNDNQENAQSKNMI